jgi:Derlin-2/3
MEFEQFIKTIPPFTKHYMIGALAAAALLSFKLIGGDKLGLTYSGIVDHLYIWTPITNFFVVGTFSFGFLFRLYAIYFAIGSLEKYHTPNKYADFAYLILICMGLIFIFSFILGQTMIMSHQFLMCLMYIYCKKEPLNKVRFMFGFVFKNAYLPWVLLIYEVMSGQSIVPLLIGIAAGHSYIVLKDILPNSQYKYNLLETPKFVRSLVAKYGPNFATNNFGGFGAGAQGQAQPQAPVNRFFRGHGVRLG